MSFATDIPFLDDVPFFASIDALEGYQRHVALLAFARSKDFSAASMLRLEELVHGLFGEQAAEAQRLARRISREAYAVLKTELDRESPARAWNSALRKGDHQIICRYLRIDPAEPHALYATLPFRILRPEGEKAWIAGAVGCPTIYQPQPNWPYLDIHDVILWNPRTNTVQLAGDTDPTLIECADWDNGRYTVFTDGFAFFRAWADRRAQIGAEIQIAKQCDRAIPREPVDSGLPGTLAIGDLDRIHWRDLAASVLVAGPGTDPETLKRAIYRAANLPRIEAPADLKAAA